MVAEVSGIINVPISRILDITSSFGCEAPWLPGVDGNKTRSTLIGETGLIRGDKMVGLEAASKKYSTNV